MNLGGKLLIIGNLLFSSYATEADKVIELTRADIKKGNYEFINNKLSDHSAAEEKETIVLGDLERTVREYVNDARKKGLISPDEQTSWVVYDFVSEETPVSINENVPRQAASMIKPLVMLAYFHKVEEGKITYTSHDKKELEKMIQRSNNRSTNYFMQKLGGPKNVERILRRDYGKILQNVSIVEYIPKTGSTYRNKASAHDYSRFLYALWYDKLPYSDEMKRIMGLPNKDMLCTSTKNVPKNIKVYDKTGSTGRLCGDMGILVARDRYGNEVPYIFIGIIEKGKKAKRYNTWIARRANVVSDVSAIVYDYMAKKHNLVRC